MLAVAAKATPAVTTESNGAPLSSPAIARRFREAQTSLLRVLAHPLRLEVIHLLCDAEMNVNGLAEKLGTVQAIVSQQLRILRLSGLVEVRRTQGFAFYRIAVPVRRDLLRDLHDCSEKLSLALPNC